jgi:hypothetical protein
MAYSHFPAAGNSDLTGYLGGPNGRYEDNLQLLVDKYCANPIGFIAR